MNRNDLGEHSNHQADSDREERLGRILADYADRVNAGEHVQTDEILEAHPEHH